MPINCPFKQSCSSSSAKMVKKSIKLNTGREMPIIGLGVFMAKPGETREAVENAIDAGYRHIDTAFLYFNEAEVGQAIRNKIKEGKIKREDIFVTTKLAQTYMTPDRVSVCLEKSMKALDIDYIDLYLVHSPMAFQDKGDQTVFPTDENGNWLLHDADHVAIWKEMEKAADSGKVKAIGLSNFNARQIKQILDNSRIKPANLQVECHLYNQQKELAAFCHKNGISLTGYGNLGNPAMQAVRNPNFNKEGSGNTNVLEEPALKPLMSKYNKSAAQVALRYLTQRDVIVIPKSVNPKRMAENIDIFDFELTKEEMETLGKLDRKERLYSIGVPENAKKSKDYPFGDPF